MYLEMLEEKEARLFFVDDDKRSAWDRLHEECPWSSVYLHSKFLEQTTPDVVLVLGWEDGALSGLLPLSRGKDFETLEGTGSGGIGRSGWLARPLCSSFFMDAALDLLSTQESVRSLRLDALSSRVPTDSFLPRRTWGQHALCRQHAVPRFRFEEKRATKSFDKILSAPQLKFFNGSGVLELKRIDLDQLTHDVRGGALAATTGVLLSEAMVLERLERAGLLRIDALQSEEQTLSFLVSVEDGGSLSVLDHGRAPQFDQFQPSLVLLYVLERSSQTESALKGVCLDPGTDWHRWLTPENEEFVDVELDFRFWDRKKVNLKRRTLGLLRSIL